MAASKRRGREIHAEAPLHAAVYVEAHDRIEDAIAREKAMKAWLRVWKLRRIQEHNPKWEELWERIVQ